MTEISVVLLGLALLLGFKHSYDADHLVAVSNLIVRSPSARSTARLSTSWAAGHMVTASLITIALFSFKETILRAFLDNLELAVIAMLFVIGVFGILSETRYYHDHIHRHIWAEHSHPHYHTSILNRFRQLLTGSQRSRVEGRENGNVGSNQAEPHSMMLGIGIVHGLASNDELLILFVASLGVTSLLGLLLGVGVFSIGVVVGMIVYGIGITYPILRYGRRRVRRVVNVSVAVLSILYALILLSGIEPLNLFSWLPG